MRFHEKILTLWFYVTPPSLVVPTFRRNMLPPPSYQNLQTALTSDTFTPTCQTTSHQTRMEFNRLYLSNKMTNSCVYKLRKVPPICSFLKY
jgi:hypothetical protein